MPHSKKRKLAPIHPGEALKEILNEAGLSANALALALRIPANRIGDCRTTLPRHPSQEVATGTVNSILKRLGLK